MGIGFGVKHRAAHVTASETPGGCGAQIRLAMLEWEGQSPNLTEQYKEMARRPRVSSCPCLALRRHSGMPALPPRCRDPAAMPCGVELADRWCGR